MRLERAGLRIDRRADALDAAGEVRAAERVDDDRRLSARRASLRELALRYVHLGDQRIEVRDLEGAGRSTLMVLPTLMCRAETTPAIGARISV